MFFCVAGAYFPHMLINFPNSIYIVFFVFLPKHGLFCNGLTGCEIGESEGVKFFRKILMYLKFFAACLFKPYLR